MGYNTTVIVLNDALHEIENDPQFGTKLALAIRRKSQSLSKMSRVDVSAGGHVNAATVIETHHADQTALVAVGGNYGTVLHLAHGWTHHEKKDQWSLLEGALDAAVLAEVKSVTYSDEKTVTKKTRARRLAG